LGGCDDGYRRGGPVRQQFDGNPQCEHRLSRAGRGYRQKVLRSGGEVTRERTTLPRPQRPGLPVRGVIAAVLTAGSGLRQDWNSSPHHGRNTLVKPLRSHTRTIPTGRARAGTNRSHRTGSGRRVVATYPVTGRMSFVTADAASWRGHERIFG